MTEPGSITLYVLITTVSLLVGFMTLSGTISKPTKEVANKVDQANKNINELQKGYALMAQAINTMAENDNRFIKQLEKFESVTNAEFDLFQSEFKSVYIQLDAVKDLQKTMGISCRYKHGEKE